MRTRVFALFFMDSRAGTFFAGSTNATRAVRIAHHGPGHSDSSPLSSDQGRLRGRGIVAPTGVWVRRVVLFSRRSPHAFTEESSRSPDEEVPPLAGGPGGTMLPEHH